MQRSKRYARRHVGHWKNRRNPGTRRKSQHLRMKKMKGKKFHKKNNQRKMNQHLHRKDASLTALRLAKKQQKRLVSSWVASVPNSQLKITISRAATLIKAENTKDTCFMGQGAVWIK